MRGTGVLGTGPKPSPRTYHSACHITGTGKPVLLITGRKSSNGTVLDEFWIMDLEDRIWRQVHVMIVQFGIRRALPISQTLIIPIPLSAILYMERSGGGTSLLVTNLV